MQVDYCSLEDLELSCQFFEAAIEYQKGKGGPSYKFVDQQIFEDDIRAKRQYKIINKEGKTAFFFSLWEKDEHIWLDSKHDEAIYLHRLLVNPSYRSQGFFQAALNWIEVYAYSKGKSYLRLDTWADAIGLGNLYIRNGFKKVGEYHVPEESEAAKNSQGNHVALFERKLYPETLSMNFKQLKQQTNGFFECKKLIDNKIVRVIQINNQFIEEDWCKKPHIGYIHEGELLVDFKNGITRKFRKGDVLLINSNDGHKASAIGNEVSLVLFETN